MSKPLVFASHSSRDQEFLRRLKELLLAKAGHAFDLFLSCDGRSIPFGANWAQEVEEALQRARLMFVFLSPNSLESPWLFFEAGYAYRHGIRVVPVGILGVEVGQVSPPLGLLHGFTLAGAGDLGRFADILGSIMTLPGNGAFTEAEYAALASLQEQETEPLPPNGDYQVVKETPAGEERYEVLRLRFDGTQAIIRSPEWESVGLWGGRRYVGRFKYHRGSAPTDMGIHDLAWNGNEFRGCCRFDNGAWEAMDLIWRPLRAPGRAGGLTA